MSHFSKSELQCKCGCGLYIHNDFHLLTLEHIRSLVKKPLIVTSGTRCRKYNSIVGGADNSDHLTGQGTDIRCYNNNTRYNIIKSAILSGVSRIGISKDFIHIGTNIDNPQDVLWLY